MIASDTPFIKLNDVGQDSCIVWISSWGWNANRKPKKRIEVSLTTSSPLTSSLNAELSRTPMMLRIASPTITQKTTTKCTHGCAVKLRIGTSLLR